MGYDLHITRANHWTDNKANPIAPEEWVRLVEADPELRFDKRNGPHFALWSGHAGLEDSWFDWSEGNIHTRYPDRPTLAKMLCIAQRLGASVQGDDGERYASVDDHPGPLPVHEGRSGEQRGVPAYARRQWLWNLLVYAAVAIAIVAVNLLDLW